MGNVSTVSHEFEFMQAQRPGALSKLQEQIERNQTVRNRNQVVTGNKRLRKESSGNRIQSGDPRLKGLESIYLNKFGSSASQKNFKINRNFSTQQSKKPPPPKKPFMKNFDFALEMQMHEMDRDRQEYAAKAIDQMEKNYLHDSSSA